MFVIVPVFTPSRDQRARGRWAFQPQEGFVGVLDDRELPETTAGHMQYATRLRGTFKGADVSLSYFDGYDSTPVLRQAMVSAGFFQVQKLTPVYTRIKAVGADVSTTTSRAARRGEHPRQAAPLGVRRLDRLLQHSPSATR